MLYIYEEYHRKGVIFIYVNFRYLQLKLVLKYKENNTVDHNFKNVLSYLDIIQNALV